MSNITLSIDDETIKQAKLRAIQEGTSLSAKMRELLQRYARGQSDAATPDLSFAENALRFTALRNAGEARRAPEQNPPPLAPNGVSVDPAYLRSIRGWAREDLYDRSAPSDT
nr:hypothetical protein [uncultured Albidiferax sp.]